MKKGKVQNVQNDDKEIWGLSIDSLQPVSVPSRIMCKKWIISAIFDQVLFNQSFLAITFLTSSCDRSRENQPSTHLVMIVEILVEQLFPVLLRLSL